jgi:hypothetical protein
MFLFLNNTFFYLIIIFILLIKLTNIENQKNTLYYIFKNYNPIREIYDKNSLCELYQESYEKHFVLKNSSKENFHILFESTVAELLVHLFQEKLNSSDSYIKVHIDTKIKLLFKNYELVYDMDTNTKEKIYISLINRMIDILSEIHIDLFNMYMDVSKFLKNNGIYLYSFENYSIHRNKIDLNYEKITFKKEILIKYSKEFTNDKLKFSKWMYFPQMNITN